MSLEHTHHEHVVPSRSVPLHPTRIFTDVRHERILDVVCGARRDAHDQLVQTCGTKDVDMIASVRAAARDRKRRKVRELQEFADRVSRRQMNNLP